MGRATKRSQQKRANPRVQASAWRDDSHNPKLEPRGPAFIAAFVVLSQLFVVTEHRRPVSPAVLVERAHAGPAVPVAERPALERRAVAVALLAVARRVVVLLLPASRHVCSSPRLRRAVVAWRVSELCTAHSAEPFAAGAQPVAEPAF